MVRVGIIGWRGMVGSVLVQRMREEKDFDHIEPVFFSTTRAGGKGRNPQTGEEITIKPSKQPRFRAGKQLKDSLN